MAIAKFISETYIKENSIVNGNVDDKYIGSTIILCQKMYLIDILGTALYNEINNEIVAGTVSTDNANLIRDYINDVLL